MSSKPTFRSSNTSQGLVENMQILTGQKGDPLDKALTLRDAAQLKLIALRQQAGHWVATPAGAQAPPTVRTDPVRGEVQRPSVPGHVTADGAFETIILTWDAPSYRGHAYAEIWRASDPILGHAVRIGTTLTELYSDAVGSAFSAVYWVRFVNQHGDAGPFQSSEGLPASTRNEVDSLSTAFDRLTVYNPATPNEKIPVFGIGEDGQVGILAAIIRSATIQLLHAEKITADEIRAGVTLSAPAITGGSLDLGNIYLDSSALGFGEGGPYSAWGKGWNTVIYANGRVATNQLQAEGGYINNATFNHCTIESDCVIDGTLYANHIVGLPVGKRFGPINYQPDSRAGNVTEVIARLALPNPGGRFAMSGILAGSGSIEVRGNPNGGYTLTVQMLLNGQVVFSEHCGQDTNRLDFIGRPFSIGAWGGTLEIRLVASGHDWSFSLHWPDAFLYTAIDL